MFLGYLTLATAFTISGVAIYYSVAGLVAIFAAAAIPIIIMGGALEIGKLVAASWLHNYWHKAVWWIRAYLSIAVVFLMLITSMGIFGFLSKAHIEQTSASKEQLAQIERIDDEILRQNQIIERANQKISKAEEDSVKSDDATQNKIDAEQERIDNAYRRIQTSIDEQVSIIDTQKKLQDDRVSVYEDEINSLDSELARLNELVTQYRNELNGTGSTGVEGRIQPYLDQIEQLDKDLERLAAQASEYEDRIAGLSGDTADISGWQTRISEIQQAISIVETQLNSRSIDLVRQAQQTIGVIADGAYGSNTRRAFSIWKSQRQSEIDGLQAQIDYVRTEARDTLSAERNRLADLVASLRGEQSDTIRNRKQSLLDDIDRIRDDSISNIDERRDSIQAKIDNILNQKIPDIRDSRKLALQAITEIRNEPNEVIVTARKEMARLRENADSEIASARAVIDRLRAKVAQADTTSYDKIVSEQEARIKEANNVIDESVNKKYQLQIEYRKLEAEVGPIKYLAEFIYQDKADADLLESAVRWVIIMIIFVFDPLAVILLLAGQMALEWNRPRRSLDTYSHGPTTDDDWEDVDDNINVTEEVIDTSEEKEHSSILPTLEEEIKKKAGTPLESHVLVEPDNKKLAKTPYDPYNDTRPDSELTTEERIIRRSVWPDGYDGNLAPTIKG